MERKLTLKLASILIIKLPLLISITSILLSKPTKNMERVILLFSTEKY